uniref:AH domain-containing protein n=1 Tax=Pyramimonas obovata TaxID=1411642 RepID=A0A7S0WWN3_9CHLO|mmetsp:Transcript_7625/g.15515  ORF Transcript_7625/g.15515 Transcript_7625/m.15515 type:complete len:444 (+) Transcript_7625:162-1493(+)
MDEAQELPQSTPSKLEDIDIREEQQEEQQEQEQEKEQEQEQEVQQEQQQEQQQEAGAANGQPVEAPAEAGPQSAPSGRKGVRATLLAGYQSMKKSIPTAAISQGTKTITTAISPVTASVSRAISNASSAISQQIETAAQEQPNGVVATTVNFSKDMADEAALLQNRVRLTLDHNPIIGTNPLERDPIVGVIPDEAIPEEPDGIRKHIVEFSRCKEFWTQLHSSMTEYYRSSTQLQSAEVALGCLLGQGGAAEKEPSSQAMAAIAEAHKAEGKSHADVNANGYKLVIEPIETFLKYAVMDTSETICKYQEARKAVGLETLNKLNLERRGARKEKQVAAAAARAAAAQKEMVRAAETALMKMYMLKGKAKVQLAQCLAAHTRHVAALHQSRAGAFFPSEQWTAALETDAKDQADSLLGEMQDAVEALKSAYPAEEVQQEAQGSWS